MVYLNADLASPVLTIIIQMFTILLSSITFFILIHYFLTTNVKKDDSVLLAINATILCFIFFSALLVCIFCFSTIFGELYQNSFRTSWCIFSGYVIIVLVFVMYSNIAIQAVYRLFRIVYSSRKWLQTPYFYKFIGPIIFIIGLVIQSPLLIWHDVEYIPSEHHCFVPFTRLRGILWTVCTAYGIPLLIISFVYLRLTFFLRKQSINVRIDIRRRQQQRDIIAIRRIVVIFMCFIIMGIPTTVNLIIANITGVEPPFTYRIQWLVGSITVAGLCISTVISTSYLKNTIMNKFCRNRVQNISIAAETINR